MVLVKKCPCCGWWGLGTLFVACWKVSSAMIFLLVPQTFHLESFPYALSTLLRISREGDFLKFLSVRKDLQKYFYQVGSYFLQHTKESILLMLLKSPLWACYSFKGNEALCLLSLAAFEIFFSVLSWGQFRFYVTRGRLPFIYPTWNFIEVFISVDGYPSAILEKFQPLSSNIVLPNSFSPSRTSIIKYMLDVIILSSMFFITVLFSIFWFSMLTSE